MLDEKGKKWLESRGLKIEIAEQLGCVSSTEDGGNIIQFPYVVGDTEVNRKTRYYDKKRFKMTTGGEMVFFNFNAIMDMQLQEEPLVITEGEPDALAAIQSGFPRTVSVPAGAPEAEEGSGGARYEFVRHAAKALSGVKPIILATDGDRPGQALMNDLALILGRARCKWVQYPRRRGFRELRCKDLNEVLLDYGERGVRETLAKARWCHVEGVYRMSELRPIPEAEAVSTGMPWLDRHFRVRKGDFSVLTGIPGHGKSTWVNDMACRIASESGWRIAFASPEQQPQTDHRAALRRWYCKKGEAYCSARELDEADAWIDRRFVFIVPPVDEPCTLEWMLDMMSVAVIQHECDMVVIDPWNEMDHERPDMMSETDYTGFAIKRLKSKARELNVHLMVVAHPTKLQAGEKPGLYSISGSSHWANKCDAGLRIHNSDKGLEISVLKSRYRDKIGTPGTVQMIFNEQTGRYSWAAGEEEISEARML